MKTFKNKKKGIKGTIKIRRIRFPMKHTYIKNKTFHAFDNIQTIPVVHSSLAWNKKKEWKSTFFSSLFTYYYGKVVLTKNGMKKTLANHFSLEGPPVCIIDYANVIHILFEKYRNVDRVIQHFYTYLLRLLYKGTRVILITKMVVIDNHPMDISHVLNMGKIQTKKEIDRSYFTSNHFLVYNMNYNVKVSSSIDDLLGHFISFVCFAFFINHGIDPKEKLTLLTNDKQYFDKNLLGKMEQEIDLGLDVRKDLVVNTVDLNTQGNYVFVDSPLDSLLVRFFLHDYMYSVSKDTENLECNMMFLLQMIYSRNDISYPSINEQVKEYLKKEKEKERDKEKDKERDEYKDLCKSNEMILDSRHRLRKNYYLYALIKHTQVYLYHNQFYGGISKDEMIHMIQ